MVFLAFDPPDAPPASYAWLPPPPKKVELVENDLLFFERQSRISLRALNFVEVIVQTWKNGDLQEDALMQMQHSLSRAVKCITQAQIASLCGLIQLRRDQYLAGSVRGRLPSFASCSPHGDAVLVSRGYAS